MKQMIKMSPLVSLCLEQVLTEAGILIRNLVAKQQDAGFYGLYFEVSVMSYQKETS